MNPLKQNLCHEGWKVFQGDNASDGAISLGP